MKNTKNGVILLISIFFISMISALIIKNLDDSNRFLTEASIGKSLIQTSIVIENLNKQLIPFLSKHKNQIDKVPHIIPLTYGNVVVTIQIEEYKGIYNLVKMKAQKKLIPNELNSKISYPSEFLQLLKTNRAINSHQKVKALIEQYVAQTRDELVGKMVDKFTFFNTAASTSDASHYWLTYDITVSNTKSRTKLVFNIDTKKIEDFIFLF